MRVGMKVLVTSVEKELHYRDLEVPRSIVRLILDLAFEVIRDETSRGQTVIIPRFGKLAPRVITKHGTTFWSVRLRRSRHWLRQCVIKKEGYMEKYGYEADKTEELVKKAAESGKCPICGAELQGSPPVCPNHGSAPFEKGSTNGQDEEG